jgi:hypothetical protein
LAAVGKRLEQGEQVLEPAPRLSEMSPLVPEAPERAAHLKGEFGLAGPNSPVQSRAQVVLLAVETVKPILGGRIR